MYRDDSLDAEPVVDATLAALISWAPTRGRPGADLREQINQVRVTAVTLLQADAIGPPLAECFDSAVACGINLQQLERVRQITDATEPTFVGAVMIKHALIQLALVTEARLIAAMKFVSRTDVDAVRNMVNVGFGSEAEAMADQMDAMTYRAVVGLHAAVSFYLVETARPLPQMLKYQFGMPMTTLGIAQRLYYDATRADEIRAENHIIHPLFAGRMGRALSA